MSPVGQGRRANASEPHRDIDRLEQAAPRTSRPLEFVEVNPGQKVPRHVRKQIRSHVKRGAHTSTQQGRRLAGDQSKQFFSSLPQGGSDSLIPIRHPNELPDRAVVKFSNAAKRPVHDEYAHKSALTKTPSAMELYAVELPNRGRISHKTLLKVTTYLMEHIYPTDTMWDIPGERAWYYQKAQDPLFLHCIMAMFHGYQDTVQSSTTGSQGQMVHISHHTQTYMGSALSQLQDRVQTFDLKTLNLIMGAVGSLCSVAAVLNDELAFESHMEGLARLLRLAGGLKAFYGSMDHMRNYGLLCRMSLVWYCKKGTPLNWLESDMPSCDHDEEETETRRSAGISSILQVLDPSLYDIFTTIQRRTEMRALRQPGKLSIALLYMPFLNKYPQRLTNMYYPIDANPINETMRIGLIASLLAWLLAAGNAPNPNYPYLTSRIRLCTERLDTSTAAALKLKLWVLIVSSMAAVSMYEPWLLREVAQLTTGMEWEDVRQHMKDIVWLPVLQDGPGELVFNASRMYTEI